MRTYPEVLNVPGPNLLTLQWIEKLGVKNVAELGVYKGFTSLEIARRLPAEGSLDLFDFEDVVQPVAEAARRVSKCVVRAHGNSYKIRDSYTWSLKKLLSQVGLTWDYVFIDGAHTWDVDGFAFLLCDLLLRSGGYVDFDDYHWNIEGSAAMRALPLTDDCYTKEQMKEKQVLLICELLVKRKGYVAVVPEKIYRKP